MLVENPSKVIQMVQSETLKLKTTLGKTELKAMKAQTEVE